MHFVHYEARRIPGDGVVARVLDEDSQLLPLPHQVHHSPTGFEMGYGGSGPADLARSILYDFCQRLALHPPVYQEFKWRFVAPTPDGDAQALTRLTITGDEILRFLIERLPALLPKEARETALITAIWDEEIAAAREREEDDAER
jgi:hypothetical protein